MNIKLCNLMYKINFIFKINKKPLSNYDSNTFDKIVIDMYHYFNCKIFKP